MVHTLIMAAKTILICDDDEGVLETLCMVLKKSGFIIIPLKKSINIFSILEKGKPDLLLLDLWMPSLPGDAIIRNLKSNPATSNIPVILISASPEGKTVASESGANGFLAKPFQLHELFDAIENALAVA